MSLTVRVQDVVEESDDPLLTIAPGWERVPLGEIASVLNGFAFPSKQFRAEGAMPLIRIRDVGTDTTVCTYEGHFDRRYLIRTGDLLVGMDGDFKTAIWNGPEGLLNQRVCKVDVSSERYSRAFLALVLPGYLDAIRRHTSSVTVAHLSSRSIAEIPLPLPPRKEQERIVAKVEALLGRVNATRERLARAQACLRRFRQAVLTAACNGRLLGGDEEWREVTIGSLLDSSFYGPRFPSSRYSSDGTPTLRTTDISKMGAIEWSNPPRVRLTRQESADLRLRPGDLVVTRTGATIGKCALYDEGAGPAIPSAYLIRFRLKVTQVEPRFALLFLLSPETQRMFGAGQTSVAQPNINARTISSFGIRLPPLDVQRAIVRRVENLFALADAIEKRVFASSARAERLTQAILGKAFRGDLALSVPRGRAKIRDEEHA